MLGAGLDHHALFRCVGDGSGRRPALKSTTSIPPLECRKPTRIPMPALSDASLARPRREGEASAFNLPTAIRHPDETCQRSASAASSAINSSDRHRHDLTQEDKDGQAHPTSVVLGTPLLECTNTLRGNAFAAAAAKAASAITMDADHGDSADSAHGKLPRVSGSNGKTTRVLTQTQMIPAMNELRKENEEPMILPTDSLVDEYSTSLRRVDTLDSGRDSVASAPTN